MHGGTYSTEAQPEYKYCLPQNRFCPNLEQENEAYCCHTSHGRAGLQPQSAVPGSHYHRALSSWLIGS